MTPNNTFGIYFKGKYTAIGASNVASYDFKEVPKDVIEYLGMNQAVIADAPTGPPAIARARRSIPAPQAMEPPQVYAEPVPMPDFDPNDAEAAAKHRALVRAASANANRPTLVAQNDDLVQAARNQAMNLKQPKSAQVQTAQQVGAVTAVAGKPKAISHAQLKAQAAAEAKESQ